MDDNLTVHARPFPITPFQGRLLSGHVLGPPPPTIPQLHLVSHLGIQTMAGEVEW